jgi:hypothetical protein
MTTPGTPGGRPRRGFMAAFQAAMAPQMPEDDGSPIVRPMTIVAAMVLAVVGGIVFLFVGLVSLTQLNAQQDLYRTQWSDVVSQCNTYVGGIGSAVPTTVATPTSATGPLSASVLPSVCATVVTQSTIPQDQLNSIKTQGTIVGAVLVVIGLAAGVGGVYLRTGAKWARRALLGAVLISLIMALLLGVSNAVTLVGDLLMIVGLVLTYVGRGQIFFLRTAQRKARH